MVDTTAPPYSEICLHYSPEKPKDPGGAWSTVPEPVRVNKSSRVHYSELERTFKVK